MNITASFLITHIDHLKPINIFLFHQEVAIHGERFLDNTNHFDTLHLLRHQHHQPLDAGGVRVGARLIEDQDVAVELAVAGREVVQREGEREVHPVLLPA